MISFGTLARMVRSFIGEIQKIGGTVQERVVFPKGLYAKPKKEHTLSFSLLNKKNQSVAFVLQKHVEDLKEGDVIITDDENVIIFHKTKKLIEITSQDLIEIKNEKQSLGTLLVEFTKEMQTLVQELSKLSTTGSPSAQYVAPPHVIAFEKQRISLEKLQKKITQLLAS